MAILLSLPLSGWSGGVAAGSSAARPGRRAQSRRRMKISSYYALTAPPYELDALEPYMSKRAVELHWGKHQKEHVDELNKQLRYSPLYGCTFEELVKKTYNNGNPMQEYNSAAEVWNHDFFWESMQPPTGSFSSGGVVYQIKKDASGANIPSGGVLAQIEKDFGSYSNFREEFILSALSLFGSGYVWLSLKREERKLEVVKTSNAINPLVWNDIPIIGLDMWEHAYYLDYKDDRKTYVTNYLDHLVSWHHVTSLMMRAEAFVNLNEPRIPVA